ncbi:unnamed protein product [Dibothriocephalus latus]|uniref:PDZ domain-containing protein n=1 Tax=Dibothriocephalus latus TaxID=60516 RepID=A0A3P6UN98_DIBLA|nr:unnamed protein product [Dibothriocephalus latus]
MRPTADFEGLGFSLVATKNQVGQFIDEVKPNSPAEKSGLKCGDMVFEVNGENILSYSHQKVVELMRKNPQELNLLVLDPDSRAYYDKASIVVNGQMPETERISSWSGMLFYRNLFNFDCNALFEFILVSFRLLRL